jgi:hypothetical protein
MAPVVLSDSMVEMKTQSCRYFSRAFNLSSLIAAIFTLDCSSGAASVPRRTKHYASSTRNRCAFGDPKYFTDNYISTNKPGVRIKVPNFDVLFEVSLMFGIRGYSMADHL